MARPTNDELIAELHASPWRAVLAVTGGGSGAISRLLETPGASATVIEAAVPYAAASLRDWLGFGPDRACSAATARAMAMRCFQRAGSLDGGDPHRLIGLGATASLASNRPKRGEHRAHVAIQTSRRTAVLSLQLEKGVRSRPQEEAIVAHAVIALLADAADVRPMDLEKTPAGIEAELDAHEAPPEWTDLLLGKRDTAVAGPEPIDSFAGLLSGSFNPRHEGHKRMAEVASQRLGGVVAYELSMANVDKPLLDFIALRDRLAGLRGEPVLLTRAATFAEKARLAPGSVFAVGVDTIARTGDPRYYDDDPKRFETAMATIAEAGCRFLVFGREAEGRFETLDTIGLPAVLRGLCDGVPEARFRVDLSSTALRGEG